MVSGNDRRVETEPHYAFLEGGKESAKEYLEPSNDNVPWEIIKSVLILV
jgi:hypothetical protein